MAPTQRTVSRERALAHDSRVALLAALRSNGEGLDAAQLGEAVGLHVNTVRSHLGLLERAGLVRRHSEPRTTPGRPRQLYSPVAPEDAESGHPPERYRLMSRMLASYIATLDDPAGAAEETGRQWGRHLLAAPPPFATMSFESAAAMLQGLLDDLGFAPGQGATPSEIELRNCPFRDVAEAHPEVACSLHLGLMRGAMGSVDAPLSVDELIPFVDPDRCVTHISQQR